MAFEKAKVLKAAEKFLSQGKIEAAIKEYRQIVENDENDFTTLNMLGDLCVRAGKKDEAIICFMRIAEHYRDKEFTLKAIAMYKKVERLKPRDPEIAENLAVLYAAQGLIVDARAQYLIVADAYTRVGKTKQALEVLRKIADLDPQNVDIRLKLAGGYVKEGLHAEATTAFKEAGTRLLEVGAFERALEAYSRALELRPYDEQALAGMVSAHTSVGTADEAAELLEKTVAERPEEIELVSMLAGAYIAAEDAKGAERATGMLMNLDASNYTRFIPVAQLYLKADEINEAARILTNIVEPMLAGREENELLELVNEMLARNPEHVEALRLLVRIHWWQRDMEKLRAALERLAEAAQAADLIDEERYALVQLVRLAPDENRYLERLELLGGTQEEAMGSIAFPPDSVAADVPSYETFAVVPEHEVSTEAQFENEFESNSVAEPAFTDPSASFAELSDSLTDSAGLAKDANGARLSGGIEFDFNGAEVSEPAEAQVAHGEPAAEASRREAMIKQELESVDFYLSQGYFDIAADTLQMLEGQFGSHPELEARRQRLTSAMQSTAEHEVSFEMGATAPHEQPHPEAEFKFEGAAETAETREPQRLNRSSPSSADKAIDSGLAEIFEEFKVAAEDESFENEDYETHYNMGTAYKEMDLIDEAIQEFQTAAALSRPGDGTPRYLQCCNMLGHCFMHKNMARAAVLWFKKGLESPGHTEDEYLALRYELGQAYEQMGDIHRAIDTFTEVYGQNIAYRGVAEKLKTLQEQRGESKGKRRRGGK
jgi:tetratricopeptide (TPR) repeat protein